MVFGRPRFAVPKDDMMPPGLQSTCASFPADPGLRKALAQGPAPLALPEEAVSRQTPPGLRKALAQGPAPLALPGEVVSRQTLVCTMLWRKVLLHSLCRGT